MFSNPHDNIEQLNLSSGQTVADLGAGSGFYAVEAAKAVGSAGKVFAIDLHHGLLERLKREAQHIRMRNIEVIFGDLEKLSGTKLSDGRIDVVLASNIFFMIQDKKTFVQEIKRILKPGGRTLVIDWSGSFGGMGPHHRHIFPKDDAVKLFKDSGFVFVKEISAGSHHYGMIFRKA